jgi:hypothetical protein
MSRLSVDVTYACHLKEGDLYAGTIKPDAPTRPVQPCARALEITKVIPYTNDEGRRCVRLLAGTLELFPLPITAQVLIIRGT